MKGKGLYIVLSIKLYEIISIGGQERNMATHNEQRYLSLNNRIIKIILWLHAHQIMLCLSNGWSSDSATMSQLFISLN